MPGPEVGPSSSFLSRLFGGDAESDKRKLAKNIGLRRMDADLEAHGFKKFDPSGMIPMAGTTKFLTEGVPNVMARTAATQKFLELMKSIGPEAEKASTLFAERYPRIAAHMKPIGRIMDKGTRGVAELDKPRVGGIQTGVRFSIRPEHLGQMEDTLLHEGTHVAQGLGNPKTYDMYKAYEGSLTPSIGARAAYSTNPFEASANAVAARKMGQLVDPVNALKLMREAVEKLPPGSPERINLARSMMR